MPLPRPPDAPPDAPTAPPPALELAQRALAPLQTNLVPLLLAGCWSFVDFTVLLVIGGLTGALLFGLIAARVDPLILAATALGSSLLTMLVFLPLLGGTMVAMLRVVADLLDRQEPPSFQAMLRHVPGALAVGAPAVLSLTALSLLGALACYLPAFLVQIAFVLLLPIRLERDSLSDSLATAWRYFRAFPGWHAAIYGINFVLAFLGGSIPFVGYALYIPAHALLITAAWRALRRIHVD